MRVVVAGAGTLGRRVTRYVSKEHTVTLIEQDPGSAARPWRRSSRAGPRSTVLHGDADEPSVLLEAGVDRADVFVAATGDDEDNLVACLLAKNEYKVKKVIAAVRNPRNRWLYNRSWGVDVALDSAQIVARLIEEEATLTDLVRLLDLQGRRCHRSPRSRRPPTVPSPASRSTSSTCRRAATRRRCMRGSEVRHARARRAHRGRRHAARDRRTRRRVPPRRAGVRPVCRRPRGAVTAVSRPAAWPRWAPRACPAGPAPVR